ncbi:MAG: patatin-like phospholipase family protein [Bacteroidales bacterium]|nr:patatin-like phospholipase family protein [Bacteroidales bacterium]
MVYHKLISLFIIFNLFSISLFSQTANSEQELKRPKVGLVLSGGGAKGFAYIGLLKVLEEVNMPLDYIGGSSMGAIIAALYSVGYSPETITKIINEQDWESFISDIQDRKYTTYEEKLFGDKYVLSIPIEKKIFALSKSLNSSFNIDLMLNNLFSPAIHIQDFNKLPIPFLCMGTDLITGEAVVLNKGNLARAVRASMAIPGYFSPTEYDGKFLVDGGVVNNYPAEQVKAMGADIIIGGDTQSGLKKNMNELTSMTTILDQVVSFSRVDANKKGKESTDYYVNIKMPYGTLDFNKIDSIIVIGEKVARAHYSELKTLADSINNIEPFVSNRSNIQPSKLINIDQVLWPELNTKGKERFNSFFEDISHSNTSISKLEENMFQLNGTKNFNELRYEFEAIGKDSVNMKIEAAKKNKGTLAAGVHYDNVYDGSILLNLTLRNINGGRAKFFSDLVLGRNPRLKTMFIINNGFRPGFGLETDFYSFGFSEYSGGTKVNSWHFENFSASAFVPFAIKNNYFFKTGFQYEVFRFKQDVVIDLDLEAYNKFADYGNLYFSFNHDSRDKVNFTKKGQLVEFKFKHVFPFSDQWVDVFSNASIMYLKHKNYVSISKKMVLQSGLFMGYTFSKYLNETSNSAGFGQQIPTVQHLFGFGGINPTNYVESHVPFTGIQFIETIGAYAGKASVNLQYNFYPKLYVTLMADAGFNEMEIDKFDDINFLFGYGAKVSYDSFIGPIEFSLMSSNIDASASAFLNIGFWF